MVEQSNAGDALGKVASAENTPLKSQPQSDKSLEQELELKISGKARPSRNGEQIKLHLAVADNEWDAAKLEYDNALHQLRHYSSLGRQDIAFVTTIQGAALTIIGDKLLSLNATGVVLSVLSCFVLLLGANSQRRLWTYMSGYVRRATQIEGKYNMLLLQTGKLEVESKRLLFSNNYLFLFFHLMLFLAWVVIWIINIIR